MTAELQAFDITHIPELSRLVDEMRATHRPRLLRRANQDVAMLVPVAFRPHTPAPANPALDAVLADEPKDSPVARTAGILHSDQPFPGYNEEREAAALAMAAEMVAQSED